MINVLALEDESYYKDLLKFERNINVDYNGLKLYKSDISKYDILVSFTFNSDLANFMICRAKLLKIKTVLLCDGIIEWSNMFNNNSFTQKGYRLFHPIIHDVFFVSGETENKYFSFMKYNTHKYLPKRIKLLKKQKNPNYKYDFLITTANNAYFNEKERKNIIELIKKVVNELELLKMTYCFRIFDDYMIKNLEIKNYNNYIKCDIETPLKLSRSLISSPSSVVITALSLDIPVGILNYRDSPLFLQTGWLISGFDVNETLVSMNNRQKERMNFQRFKLKEYTINNKSLIDINFDDSQDFDKDKYEKLLNHYAMKVINSKFNFNFEYFLRKIFKKIKKYVIR